MESLLKVLFHLKDIKGGEPVLNFIAIHEGINEKGIVFKHSRPLQRYR